MGWKPSSQGIERAATRRYAIEPMEPPETLSEDEEQGVLAGLQELDAGRGIPLVDVVREIRTHSSSKN